MQNIQDVWTDLQDIKAKLKDARRTMQENYNAVPEFCEITEKQKDLAIQKKRIKKVIDEQFPDLAIRIEDLKIDYASQKELVNDIAMTMLMSNKPVEVQDKYQQTCMPLFSVKFVKE